MEVWSVVHILGLVLWVGGLMNITRMLAFHVQEEAETQKRLHYIENRINKFVTIPGAILSLTAGLFMLMPQMDVLMKQPWFHAKLTFVFGLLVVQLIMTSKLAKLKDNQTKQKAVPFKVMHGLSGLLLIFSLVMIYVRPWSVLVTGE